MTKKIMVSFIIVVLMMYSYGLTGCSRHEEPTQADLSRAIIEYALSMNCPIITSSIKIVEKGKHKEDGSLSYKVYFACQGQPLAAPAKLVTLLGKEANLERFLTLELYKTVDSSGKPDWTVRR